MLVGIKTEAKCEGDAELPVLRACTCLNAVIRPRKCAKQPKMAALDGDEKLFLKKKLFLKEENASR